MVAEGIKRKHFKLGKIECPVLSAINIGFAGTSAPSTDAQKNILFNVRYIGCGKGSSGKYFELGKVEHPILSALNIGVAGTSAPRRDA